MDYKTIEDLLIIGRNARASQRHAPANAIFSLLFLEFQRRLCEDSSSTLFWVEYITDNPEGSKLEEVWNDRVVLHYRKWRLSISERDLDHESSNCAFKAAAHAGRITRPIRKKHYGQTMKISLSSLWSDLYGIVPVDECQEAATAVLNSAPTMISTSLRKRAS